MGSLLAALLSHCASKYVGGRWLLRIEDTDLPRCKPEFTESILNALEAHGLTWDDQWQLQSHHRQMHLDAAHDLMRQNIAYYCDCSRKSLRNADIDVYPGLCRTKKLASKNAALRFQCSDVTVEFDDLIHGYNTQNVYRDVGDFPLVRRDAVVTYQLAVVVDDALSGVNLVVRGEDLLDNIPRQILLQRALGYATPVYAHTPLILASDKQKLSKQTGARALNNVNAIQNLATAWGNVDPNPLSEVDQIGDRLAEIQQRFDQQFGEKYFLHLLS